MNLKNSIQEFNNRYTLKDNIPAWFLPTLKTILSRNVTIEAWNDAIQGLQQVSSDDASVKEFIDRFSENLDNGDLSKLIATVEEILLDNNRKKIVFNYVNGTFDEVIVHNDKIDFTTPNDLKNVKDTLETSIGSLKQEYEKRYKDLQSEVSKRYGAGMEVFWENEDLDNIASRLKIVLKNGNSEDLFSKIIDFSHLVNTNVGTNTPLGISQYVSDVSYVKDIPATSGNYAEVYKVGGITRKCTNLLDSSFIVNTSTASAWARKEIVLKPNTTYVVSCNIPSSLKSIVGIFFYNSQGVASGAENQVTEDKDVLINTLDDGIVKIKYIIHDLTYDISSYNYMLNEGSTALPYEPYFEGLRDAKVTEIKSIGINIWDEEWVVVDGTHIGSKNLIPVKPNTKYYTKTPTWFANGIYIYDRSGTAIGSPIYASERVFTTPENCYFIEFRVGSAYGTVYNNNICINEYDTAINGKYFPYTEHTLEIPETVQNIDGYSLGIPNTEYYNYIDFVDKKFGRLAREKVFDGTENFIRIGTKQYAITLTDCLSTPYNNNVGICSHFDYTNDAYSGAVQGFVINNQTLIFCYRELEEDNVTLFKNKIAEWYSSGNPITLIYPLATPETEDISNLITSDNLIPVEGGGTITFENEYKYDVPNDVLIFKDGVKLIVADNIIGNIRGKMLYAETSEYANRDANGNLIHETYLTKTDSVVSSDSRYVTPQMFGAVADGVADDTQAIKDAISNAKGRVISLNGKFLISEPIILGNNTKLVGTPNTSVYKLNNNYATVQDANMNAAFILDGNNISISDIQIYGKSDDMTMNNSGIAIGIAYMFNIERVRIVHMFNGIRAYNSCWMGNFTRVHCLHCENGFDFKDNFEKTSLTFNNCWCQACGDAYNFRSLNYSNFLSCGADWCNGTPEFKEYAVSENYKIPAVSKTQFSEYGYLRGDPASSLGVYTFKNCKAINVSGCGAEYSNGNGVLYIESSNVSINDFTCSYIGTHYKKSDETPGFIVVSGGVVGVIITNFQASTPFYFDNGLDSQDVAKYVIGYNAYPTHHNKRYVTTHIVQMPYGITMFGGNSHISTDCFNFDDLPESSESETPSTTTNNYTFVKTVTNSEGGNKLSIAFNHNGDKNRAHLLSIKAVTYDPSGQAISAAGFEITLVFNASSTIKTTIPIISHSYTLEKTGDLDPVYASASEDLKNLIINLPATYTGLTVRFDVILRDPTVFSLDLDNLKLIN